MAAEGKPPELQIVIADEVALGSLLRDWTGDFVVVHESAGRRPPRRRARASRAGREREPPKLTHVVRIEALRPATIKA